MTKQEAIEQAIYNGYHNYKEERDEILATGLISLAEYNHNYRIGEKSRDNGEECYCGICKESS